MRLLSGTVTFLFTDVEGSTALVERLGDAWPGVLHSHRQLLRMAVRAAGGEEVDVRGEEFLAAFPTARAAVDAARAAQQAHAAHAWPEGAVVRVRMGIHTGEPTVADSGYLGLDVHRGARICALSHGGQVLLSQTTRDLFADVPCRDLGSFVLKGVTRPEQIFQLVVPGLRADFPRLRVGEEGKGIARGRERDLAAAASRAVRGLGLRRGRAHRGRRRVGLADAGWHVRAAIPSARPEARAALVALSDELFAASRTAAEVDFLLAAISRDALDRRLADLTRVGEFSQRVLDETDAAAARLHSLGELVRLRSVLDDLAALMEISVADPQATEQVRHRLQATWSELHAEFGRGRDDLEAHGSHLRHALWPGVYRQGYAYVVPYMDELGIKRARRFDSLAGARAFRRAVHVATHGTPVDQSYFFRLDLHDEDVRADRQAPAPVRPRDHPQR